MQQESTAFRRWGARAGMVLATLFLALTVQSPALAKKAARAGSSETPLYVEQDGARAHADKTIDRIISDAEKRHRPARVRRVEESTYKGRRVYVLRLQKDGKIWEIRVDAETEKEL